MSKKERTIDEEIRRIDRQIVAVIVATLLLFGALVLIGGAVAVNDKNSKPAVEKTFRVVCDYNWRFCATLDAQMNLMLTAMPR